MTIKEMEERCGMSRRNIRFYESEGLLSPERKENGYRDYSEEDAQLLLKVKLLRAMEIPLEEVRALNAGEEALADTLTRLEQELDRKQLHQERTREAAQQMLREEQSFDTLAPERYLPLIETGEAPWKEDAAPGINLPWRRYWARMLDYSICVLLVSWLLHLFPVWDHNRFPLNLLAMLLLEPLALCLFGTTPGKAIFGIRILDPEGGKLDYDTALERTWTVLWEGEALRIPVVSEYFRYKSYRDAEDDLTLPWEWDSELVYADGKNWRYLLYFVAYGAVLALQRWPLWGGG